MSVKDMFTRVSKSKTVENFIGQNFTGFEGINEDLCRLRCIR